MLSKCASESGVGKLVWRPDPLLGCCLVLFGAGVEPRSLLGKYSTVELHSQPLIAHFYKQSFDTWPHTYMCLYTYYLWLLSSSKTGSD